MKIYMPGEYVPIFQGYGLAETKPSMLKFYQDLGLAFHNGWDFIMPHGAPIYFNVDCEGIVYRTQNDQKLGVGITIITNDGKIYRHRYWHGVMGSIQVQVGQKVQPGDLLMFCDNTGMSTGDHLHYDLAELDKDFNVLNGDNGGFGCIDPLPYYTYKSVLNYVQQVNILKKIVEIYKQIILILKK